MRNKKFITLLATIGLITCLHTNVDAVKFYDTLGTRYEGAVERLGELEIINGISDKVYNADRNVTRAEFAKLIVEASLTEEQINALIIDDYYCNFKDVSKSDWYYKYVLAATNYGYINGYEDNTFKPNKEVSYEEAAKMFMKALGHEYLVETDPRGWSAEYMDKLYSLNITDGTTKFNKADKATRGNIAIMLWNSFTSNVWEKIYLNDVAGFTFVDSDTSLFDKKIEGYVFRKDVPINGFKEINGKICVETTPNTYYQLYDQDINVKFSMIGGTTDVLYRVVRYPQNTIKYEIVGLSPDIGSQLYFGTLEDLKEEIGNSFNIDTKRISSRPNYAFFIEAENEYDKSRLVTVNTKNKRFVIENIKIDSKSETIKDDDDEKKSIIEKADKSYLYRDTYEVITKKITINEDYEIQDGAVLFENNKRVNWSSLKKGDVITEIKKDEYYFVSREQVQTVINEYEKTDEEIKFSTSEGDFIAYYNSDSIEVYSRDNKKIYLSKMKKENLDELINVKVNFYIDCADNIARIEILDNVPTDPDKPLENIGVGFYKDLSYGSNNKNMITIISDGKTRAYNTALQTSGVDKGTLIYFELENASQVKSVKEVTGDLKINENLALKKITYEKIEEDFDKGVIGEDVVVYHSKYYYDIGEYNKIIGFDVKREGTEILEDAVKDKSTFYVLTDKFGNTNYIIYLDFSEQKDIFYGKVINIYTEDKELKMELDILESKTKAYKISGLLNCEEGDLISYKMINDSTIEVVEKYSTNVLGYYKDIVVKDVRYNKQIISENGKIDLNNEVITIGEKNHILKDYDIIFLKVKKDDAGIWSIIQGKLLKPSEINLDDDDRIAINEIENTIIIYRGYSE